jgi:hypothetical protein
MFESVLMKTNASRIVWQLFRCNWTLKLTATNLSPRTLKGQCFWDLDQPRLRQGTLIRNQIAWLANLLLCCGEKLITFFFTIMSTRSLCCNNNCTYNYSENSCVWPVHSLAVLWCRWALNTENRLAMHMCQEGNSCCFYQCCSVLLIILNCG